MGPPKSLLLVDDEPRVLQTLRRMLTEKVEEWDIELVEGGKAALERLEERSFDLVLCDLHMPDVGGDTVLTKVCELHPAAARLLLVGPGELDTALRSVTVAHQVVAKPKQGSVLVTTLERCLDLGNLLESVKLRSAAASLDRLPSAPTTYLAIREAARDPEVSIATIAGIIEKDVALTAKILQLVNSSLFTLAQETTSIQHAASHLGLDMLRSVCLTSEMFTMFEGRLPTGFSFEEQQRHAHRLSQLLVRIVADDRVRERAVLAAFLHDVGTLVEVTQLPEEFLRIQRLDQHVNMSMSDLERRVMGVSHAEIGAYLLGLWGMPFEIVEAVAYHHEPSRSSSTEMCVLGWVHVADTLIEEVDGVPLGGKVSQLDGAFLRRLGVEPDEVQEWRRLASRLDEVTAAA